MHTPSATGPLASQLGLDPARHTILFYDGVCNVCNASVQYAYKHDHSCSIRFAALQSPLAQELLPPRGVDPTKLDSLVLLHRGQVYTHSEAVIQLACLLGGWRNLAFLAYLLPGPVRDAAYNAFARNRYRWFGQRQSCMLPPPDLRARLLG